MKMETMNFNYSTFYNDKVKETNGISVLYSTPKIINSEEYEIYKKIFESYIKAANLYGIDIINVVSDIRNLFGGTEEHRLDVKIILDGRTQIVKYKEQVECYFFNRNWNDKTIVCDNEHGFSIDFFKERNHLTSDSKKELMVEINEYMSKIIVLKDMKPNLRKEEPTIFGYSLDRIKEEDIKFSFGATLYGDIEINTCSKYSNTSNQTLIYSYKTDFYVDSEEDK